MIWEILTKTIIHFLQILPILVAGIIISQIISAYTTEKKLHKYLKNDERALAKASAIGIATPGPLLAYLPFLKVLKKKKVSLGIIAAFITGQTLIGPVRIFLEVGYFGIEFFIYRLIIAFLIAVWVGVIFETFAKKLK